MIRIARIRTTLLVLVAACAVAPVAHAQAAPDPRGVDPNQANPLVGLPWFVDKRWAPQYWQYRRYRRRGQRYRASLLAKIALQPQFKWFGRWNENDKGGTAGTIRRYLARVQDAQPGRVPQIVVMRHQGQGVPQALHRGRGA